MSRMIATLMALRREVVTLVLARHCLVWSARAAARLAQLCMTARLRGQSVLTRNSTSSCPAKILVQSSLATTSSLHWSRRLL